MGKDNLALKIRYATNEDIPFIFSSWLKCFRDTGLMNRGVPNTIYFQNHHKILQKIAQRAKIYVACNASDVSQIYGWIAGEYIEGTFVLHFIYIKHAFRKLGVGRELYNAFNHNTGNASCCTHLTKPGEQFLTKYNLIYHPYLILVDYEVPEIANEGFEVKSDRP